jgi:hypothetical protein
MAFSMASLSMAVLAMVSDVFWSAVICPLRPLWTALKGWLLILSGGSRVFVAKCFGSIAPPTGSILQNPIEQSFFKADIAADLLAFDPFVAQDFIPFGEEFFIED